jgi:hypothetical protein
MVFGVCGFTATQGSPDPALGDPYRFFPLANSYSLANNPRFFCAAHKLVHDPLALLAAI